MMNASYIESNISYSENVTDEENDIVHDTYTDTNSDGDGGAHTDTNNDSDAEFGDEFGDEQFFANNSCSISEYLEEIWGQDFRYYFQFYPMFSVMW